MAEPAIGVGHVLDQNGVCIYCDSCQDEGCCPNIVRPCPHERGQ